MMPGWGSSAARGLVSSAAWLRALVFCVVLLTTKVGQAQLVPCHQPSDAEHIANALAQIAHSVDPCGDSAQVIEVLETLERCTKTTYQICTNAQIDRNLFDRPTVEVGGALGRTINWNPTLRSQLEPRCDGDPAQPLLRDPTASLLHELVHAAHDCLGINPGEHEIEAVRIENIYRRAAGLCQRGGYGEEPLPAQLVKACLPGNCPCSSGDSSETRQTQLPPIGRQLSGVTSNPAPLGDSVIIR
jgi:hypothetical protein